MLPRARHKRCPQPHLGRRQQIPLVRRHHQHLLRLQPQQFDRRAVAFRVGLVVLRHFGSQDAVPGHPAVFRHIGHQRNVAVGHRRDDEPRLEPIQARHAVGPGAQVVPEMGDFHFLGIVQPHNVKLGQRLVQRHPMQGVQVGPGQRAAANLVHIGAILAAPGVGESPPIPFHALDAPHRSALLNDAGTPVHHRAENIKNAGPNIQAQRGDCHSD